MLFVAACVSFGSIYYSLLLSLFWCPLAFRVFVDFHTATIERARRLVSVVVLDAVVVITTLQLLLGVVVAL